MRLESNLHRALRRESPAPGFASRVLERIESGPLVRRTAAPWRAVAAGVIFVALSGGWFAHHEIERRAGERARDDALLALHIASAKIHTAQERVRDIGAHSND
jgi:anti-sigma factor RsiW